MNARLPHLSAILALTLSLMAPPARAALFDDRAVLDVKVSLSQPVLCDGSVRLAPGLYDVHLMTSANGTVHATFFQRGVRKGEARGIIAVRKAGGERTQTFSSLGFHSASPSAFRQDGQKLSLEIGNPGTNQILIGLLLPAVKTGLADGSAPNATKIQDAPAQNGK